MFRDMEARSHPCKPVTPGPFFVLSLIAALLFMLSPTCTHITCYRLIGFPCVSQLSLCVKGDNQTRDVVFQGHICQGCP